MIRTSHIRPPVPSRSFDWCAWLDGHEEGETGYGATEAEAVKNLREQLECPLCGGECLPGQCEERQ